MSDDTPQFDTLCEQEQQLLCRYCDGELGFFERRKVAGLLKRSDDARIFVESHQSLCHQVSLCLSSEKASSLWETIADGIEREERQALLSHESESWFSSLFPKREGVVWGLSGACVAACITMVMLPPAEPVPSSSQQMAQTRAPQSVSAGIVPVAHRQAAAYDEEENVYGSQPVEVDWLRSSGRVKMIAGSGRSAPIMWISRRERTPDPVNIAGDEPIRMLPERTPHAFSVSSSR